MLTSAIPDNGLQLYCITVCHMQYDWLSQQQLGFLFVLVKSWVMGIFMTYWSFWKWQTWQQVLSSNVQAQIYAEVCTYVVFLCRDKRAKLDPKEYMIDGKTGENFYKLPGSINGQQFIIQNCEVR